MRVRSTLLAACFAASSLAFSSGCTGQVINPASASKSPARVATRPNVVVILVDDLGWPDVSTYGRNTVPTPNIDRIARNGVAFTNGYVPASVCAVSRAGLLTGRVPAEMGFTYNITDRGGVNAGAGLPVGQLTMADRLKAHGYATAVFGKWHQGAERRFYPTNRGFDEFFGFIAGETSYVSPDAPGFVTTPTKADRQAVGPREGNQRIVEGPDARVVENADKYLTTEITDRTVDFMRRQAGKGQPFFAYVAYNAPHWPLQVQQEYFDRFAHIEDPVRRTYVAMIAALDDGVGTLLDALQAMGQQENTIVVFLSDNGCPVQYGFCDADHPWGAGKFTYLEGGTRVPFLVSWPGGIKSRGLVDTPVSALDILPTALAAITPGQPLPAELDGRDLVATLSEAPETERTLVWGQDPVFAVRQGRFKLWHSSEWQKTYLYDLDQDPAELNDISHHYPEVRTALERILADWRGALPEPLWPRQSTRTVTINGRETQWVY